MQRAILHAASELTCGGLSGANRQEGGMGMKKFTKRFSFLLLTVMMVLGFAMTSQAAKLNAKKIKVPVGTTYVLKVKGAKGKVTWKSSRKSVATVKKGKVTALKKGTAKITAKVRGKKYTCKVTVVDNVFVSQDIDNFAVPDIQGDRVLMKVSKIRQVSKNRMDITIMFKPVDGDIRVNRFRLSLYDNHQQSFFAEVVNLNTPIYVNYQQVYTLTVRCNRKNFPSMRNIDLRKLNDGNFGYWVNLNL